MFPDTLVGLLVFLVAVSPGYVWVRSTERSVSRHDRSTLLELAEIVVAGSLASILSAIAVLELVAALEWLDVSLLLQAPVHYALTNPAHVLGAFFAFLLLSFAIVVTASRMSRLWRPPIYRPGAAWDTVFDLGAKRGDGRSFVWANVELTDGRVFSGQVAAFTVGDDEQRELVLHGPFRINTGGQEVLMNDQYIVLKDQHIVTIVARRTDN